LGVGNWELHRGTSAYSRDFAGGTCLASILTMASTPKTGHKQDGMLVAGAIAAVAATALIFFAAWQTPIAHNAGGKHLSRAEVNAAEEHKIWSRSDR
jgi:hypothetical protein